MQNHEHPILTPNLLQQASAELPGDWLSKELCVASAHWRIENERSIHASDLALRALFLIAYREHTRGGVGAEDSTSDAWIDVGRIDFSQVPSLPESTDTRFGAGFYAAVRAHSQVLVDHTPTSDPTELLSGFSDFIRFEASGLSAEKGPATRSLEAIWEQMDVGWVN